MDAILFFAQGKLKVVNHSLPSVTKGNALVRVRAAGLCHTDIDVLHGRYGTGAFPIVPGHEFSGIVEAIADDVDQVKPGDRVAIDPNIPCGTCRQCSKGLSNLCVNLKAYGVTQDGGFAEYSLVAADHLHDIGDLSFETAALAEPLACVLNGLDAAGLGQGSAIPERALVFGAGPIGLLLAFALRAAGAEEIVVADINDQRLVMAHELGFSALRAGSDELARHGFDFVADATGNPAVVEGMIDYTANGGTVLIFGVCAPNTRVQIAPFEIFRRQIKIVGSHSLNRNIPQALAVLKRQPAISKLVTHRLSLDQALPYFSKGGGDAATMKVQYMAESGT